MLDDTPLQSLRSLAASLAVAASLGLTPGVVNAQDDGPSVNPSRPTITNSPDIGPAGYVELDVGTAAGDRAAAFPVLVKAAVSRQLELRVGMDTVVLERAAGTWSGEAGALGAWVQFIPAPVEEGVRWAVGAGAAVDTVGQDHSPTWTAGFAFGQPIGDLRWDANLGAANAPAEAAAGRAWELAGSAVLSWGIGDLSIFVEGATATALDSGSWGHRALGGLAWSFGPRLVADAAVELPFRTLDGFDAPTFHLGVSALIGRR